MTARGSNPPEVANNRWYPRPPRGAAVCVTASQDGETNIRDAMTRVREEVDPDKLGVKIYNTKRTLTGGVLIEIRGADRQQQARTLANKIEEVLEGSGVKVTTPVKTTEVRLHRFEESVTAEEIAKAVAKKGGCCTEQIRVGPIRMAHHGLCVVVIRCPQESVARLARGGHVMVGWSAARVEVLPPRRLTCYRCLEPGHVSAMCRGSDRSNRCYRCGEEGHAAKACPAERARCALCFAQGRPADHKSGGGRCAAIPTARSIPVWKQVETTSTMETQDKKDDTQIESPGEKAAEEADNTTEEQWRA